jgi:hypothetical protein
MDEIRTAVRKSYDRMKVELNTKGNDNKVELQEIFRLIDSKVDKTEFLSYLTMKSNIKDTAI